VHLEHWPDILGEFIDLEAEGRAQMGIQIIGELRRFKSSQGLPLNTPLQQVTIYSKEEAVKKDLEVSIPDIEGTIRIEDLQMEVGRPEVQEVVVEVTPRMDRVGPHFKGDAPKIVAYLESQDPQELGETLKSEGQLETEGLIITPDFLKIRKEVVGKTGEKVHLIQVEELDLVVEVQV
jgi:valyl-tRNA synthetase